MILILCRKKKTDGTVAKTPATNGQVANGDGNVANGKRPDVMADADKVCPEKRSQNSDRSSCISDLKLDLKDAEVGCEIVSIKQP